MSPHRIQLFLTITPSTFCYLGFAEEYIASEQPSLSASAFIIVEIRFILQNGRIGRFYQTQIFQRKEAKGRKKRRGKSFAPFILSGLCIKSSLALGIYRVVNHQGHNGDRFVSHGWRVQDRGQELETAVLHWSIPTPHPLRDQ